MAKYWTIFKANLASFFEYRTSLVIWFLVDLVVLASAVFLWLAVYREHQSVGGYNFFQILIYFILVPVVGNLTSVHNVDILPFQIKNGDISTELLKPYSIAGAYYVKPIALKVSQQFFKMPVLLILLCLVFHFFKVNLNLGSLILGVFVCPLAYTLNFLIDLCVSYTAFWVDDAWALTHLKYICLAIFGGMLFPLNLVSAGLSPLFNFLPFHLIIFFPIQIIQGLATTGQITSSLFSLLIWIIVLFSLSKVIWHQGLRKYGAYGN